ncbi:MAG TPA: isoaspartyl peptidase/L-asparaginase [Rhodothermales bacterium]|nr:isoaspartyl peptidase/L-asparaginase [Rhodothermales bacterium]
MYNLALILAFVFLLAGCSAPSVTVSGKSDTNTTFAIAIHGGAGVISKAQLSPEREAAIRNDLERALKAGQAILTKGGTSMDAVVAAVNILEDSPYFNAGKGAVLTSEGHAELDAAIMDGKTLGAGAVTGLRQVKNPINLARAVMEKSPHVMLSGNGAEVFARSAGIEMVAPSYFVTPERQRALEAAKRKENASGMNQGEMRKLNYGTVGAVALDRNGNLAAATSTGGMTNKKWGRVGDAPIIGAGTYANNASAAISATGWGEFFIRSVVAHDIAALIEYKGLKTEVAAQTVIDKVGQLGGDGGVIVMDRKGQIAMPFNSEGMYRGWANGNLKPETRIFKEK